eukprot:s3360_g8.t1
MIKRRVCRNVQLPETATEAAAQVQLPGISGSDGIAEGTTPPPKMRPTAPVIGEVPQNFINDTVLSWTPSGAALRLSHSRGIHEMSDRPNVQLCGEGCGLFRSSGLLSLHRILGEVQKSAKTADSVVPPSGALVSRDLHAGKAKPTFASCTRPRS